MTITLDLPQEIEETIADQARQRNMKVSEYLLDIALQAGTEKKREELLEYIDSWDDVTEEEAAEQKEAWEFLRHALDEDRLSPGRPLFPKGSRS